MWKKHIAVAALAASAALGLTGETLAAAPAAGPAPAVIAAVPATPIARFEFRAFQSATLSDQDFLLGKTGQPVTIAAEIRLPAGVPAGEKLPAVVLLEGSGGLGSSNGTMDAWAAELNKRGVVAVLVDSFTNRGIIDTLADQTQLGRLNMAIDAWRALEFLAKDTRIDATRVALMGFSRGGQATLTAAMKRFQQMYGPAGGLEFAAYFAEYPWCGSKWRDDTNLSDKPILITAGDQDDYTVAHVLCKEYVDRLPKKDNVKFIVYPGGQHAFDNPTSVLRMLPTAVTNRKCRMAEGDNGVILNVATNKPYDEKTDTCVEKGPTVGYNPDATTKLRADTMALLTTVLKLKP